MRTIFDAPDGSIHVFGWRLAGLLGSIFFNLLAVGLVGLTGGLVVGVVLRLWMWALHPGGC
jgi:hypothetical protein